MRRTAETGPREDRGRAPWRGGPRLDPVADRQSPLSLPHPRHLILSSALLLAAGCAESDATDTTAEAIGRGGGSSRIDICHYTSSSTNPLNELSVNSSAWSGHEGHGDVLQGDWWPDADGDGFGDGSESASTCPPDSTAATTWVQNGDDCDDTDATVNPDAEEVCGDGIDNNCSGDIDETCDVCPCYNDATLDMALDSYDAVVDGFDGVGYERNTEYCRTRDYRNIYDSTRVDLNARDDERTVGGGFNSSRTYALGIDYDRHNSRDYCRFDLHEVEIDADGNYVTNNRVYNYDRRLSTAEADACVTELEDWATSRGLTCY
jgi:hypothetical protein